MQAVLDYGECNTSCEDLSSRLRGLVPNCKIEVHFESLVKDKKFRHINSESFIILLLQLIHIILFHNT